jgi:N-acetylated-alpha-linked acidic dipeptidase
MARVFGLEIIRMAQADVLPYDFEQYGKEVGEYVAAAQKHAQSAFPGHSPDFGAALAAAQRLALAGAKISELQKRPSGVISGLNATLVEADRALLLTSGLPGRPWFRHAIYAPGKHAGYAAAVIPGVNDSIDDKNVPGIEKQLAELTSVLDHAAAILESAAAKR